MNEYLEQIKLIAQKLSDVDKEWGKKIYSEYRVSDDIADLGNELEKAYFDAAKQAIKETGSIDELNKKVSKIIGNKVFVSLHEEMEGMILLFDNTFMLGDIPNATGYIRDCFDRYILRNDKDFTDDYAIYGFKSAEEMIKANNAILRIAINHTMMAYSLNSAKKEFKKISELDDAVCGFYAEKFDNCYDKLQMRLLFKSYENLSDQMDMLMDFVYANDEE